MNEFKYIIFIVILFASVAILLAAGELWKRLRSIKREETEKILKFLIMISFLVLVVVMVWIYQHQKGVNFCKDKCISSFEGWRFSSPDIPLIEMNFDTQKQCIDFCISLFKDLKKEEWKSMDLKSIY